MNLGNIITNVQTTLDDAGVHYTSSGVSVSINEGQRILSMLTLFYERHSTSWSLTGVTSQQLMGMPVDCIAPIYVRDATAGSRIYPVKIRNLEASDLTWWNTTGSAHQYYSLFNPSFREATGTSGYSMMVYPLVASRTLRVEMIYGAVPPTLTATTDAPKVPLGERTVLSHYGRFMGLIRQNRMLESAVEHFKRFVKGVERINNLMRARYPEGRDFEPEPVEDILQRTSPQFVEEKRRGNRPSTRNRTR